MPIYNKRKVTSWDPWLLRGSVSFCSLRSAVHRETPDTPTLVPVLSSLYDDCVLSEPVGRWHRALSFFLWGGWGGSTAWRARWSSVRGTCTKRDMFSTANTN